MWKCIFVLQNAQICSDWLTVTVDQPYSMAIMLKVSAPPFLTSWRLATNTTHEENEAFYPWNTLKRFTVLLACCWRWGQGFYFVLNVPFQEDVWDGDGCLLVSVTSGQLKSIFRVKHDAFECIWALCFTSVLHPRCVNHSTAVLILLPGWPLKF